MYQLSDRTVSKLVTLEGQTAKVLRASEFELEVVQLSAFVKDEEFAPSRVTRWALRDRGDRYDGDPISVPDAPHVPPEIATSISQSADGKSKLEAARTRINAYRYRGKGEPLDLFEEAKSLLDDIVEVIAIENVSIGRLALLVSRICDQDEAAKAIAEHFFKEQWLSGPINRPESTEIHSHKVYRFMGDTLANSWMRVRTGQRIETKTPVVVVDQDINTREEDREQTTFSRDLIAEFVNTAVVEIDVVQSLYFPD